MNKLKIMTPDWRKRNRCSLLRQTENSRLSFLTFRKLNNQYKLSSAQYSHSSYCSLDSAYQSLRACFVCLLGVFRPTGEFFNLYGESDVTITGEGLQISTYMYVRHLSSEGSLTCHTYCDSRHPFIWSSMRACDTHLLLRASGKRAVTACFNHWCLSRLGFEHPSTFRLRGERFNSDDNCN